MVYMYVDTNRVKSWELVRNGSLRIIKIPGPTVAVCCRNTLTPAEYRKIAGGDTRPTNQPTKMSADFDFPAYVKEWTIFCYESEPGLDLKNLATA